MDSKAPVLKNITVADDLALIFCKLFESAKEGILITNSQNEIIGVNPAFTEITGYSFEETKGKNPNMMRSDRHEKEFYRVIWSALKKDHHWHGEIWNRKKNGEAYLQRTEITAIIGKENSPVYYVAVINDITHSKDHEKNSDYYQHYDPLTGLANRFLFQDRLLNSMLMVKEKQHLAAVFLLNIDRFKNINNSFGFLIGDLLLTELAQRIKGNLRENESLYRIGADHFALVLTGIQKVQEVFRAASRIQKTVLDKPFTVEENEISITASIGISIYPLDSKDVQDIIQNAEISMHRAKQQGGNQYQLYQPDMNLKSFENLLMETKLRKAIERNEFVVYYQPQICLKTGSLVGAEALARWKERDFGLISPDRFIPLAEEIGLIDSIGFYILQQACVQTETWQTAKKSDFTVAVNLSAKQFRQKNLPKKIEKALRATRLDSRFLEIEMTESAAVENVQVVIQNLKDIASLGIKLAIDDFGTGYSSFAYLKNFPLHKLKIDKSFIFELLNDPKSRAIVATIISLGHNLGLKVIAEGVETKEQLETLKEMGCDEVQGYYYSQPVAAKDFQEKFL